MGFDGTEGAAITLADASSMTKEYRTRGGGTTLAHFFGKDIIEDILAQEGCMGIRIYYGLNPTTGKQELILVGANEEENDMLDLVADLSKPCPSSCSDPNVLNS